jgi:hypothetical protein
MKYPVTATLSVDAVQVRFMLVDPFAVARRLEGAVGGVVSVVPPEPAALNATICITHVPEVLAVAL